MECRNPILCGFYPDPSICRVDLDYYLITSSFEYFPGVTIFHSRDLVHWQQIGHCLERDSQLPLQDAKSSAGIWAPSLRFHDGVFYMVTTNMSHGGNFYVTATDPAGPWSEPIWLDDPGPWEGGGIDPSLLFDADGKVYYTRESLEPLGIVQAELDLAHGRLLTKPRLIWPGTGGPWPEGPHLYRIGDTYYLTAAEGGCWLGHRQTIARASSPWGPFESCPRNPILTHRHLCGLESPVIQGVGHGDLVEAHDGSWWMVCLGHRPLGAWHLLGRETSLAPVTWDDEGWPLVGRGGLVEEEFAGPGPAAWEPIPEPIRDDFDGPALGLCWNYRGNPDLSRFDLSARPGWLRLRGSGRTLDDALSNTFVGRRQQHFTFRAEVCLDFEPAAENEEAGVTVLANETHHCEIGVRRNGHGRTVFVRRRIGDLTAVVAETEVAASGRLRLRIAGNSDAYTFACAATDDSGFRELATAQTRYLCQEVAGCFTGTYIGVYATGNGAPAPTPADFDWFEYEPLG